MNKIVEVDGELIEFVPCKKTKGFTLKSLTKDKKMVALTKKEKDQRNGSKSRRKPLTPAKAQARVDGVAKILALLSRATKGRIASNHNIVMQTVMSHGL